ncbi:hypothetical protein [Calycomorphotria hydatis]|uniref:Uncharacterized protein n=1 Tax=Calycomorphotria hydatis TaxID=2528027 RepID=A0A517TBY2_9PLAN|nr:hypothetical protein [Calycomorphotria hydatis]QDT65874.1 hypothetical protein V22_31360 [Calycomorphotria hydatis]
MSDLRNALKEIGTCPDFRMNSLKSAIAAFAFACMGSWLCCELNDTFADQYHRESPRTSKIVGNLVASFVHGDEKSTVEDKSSSRMNSDFAPVQPPPLAPSLNPEYAKFLERHELPHRERRPVEAPRPQAVIFSEETTSSVDFAKAGIRGPFRQAQNLSEEEFYMDDRVATIIHSFGWSAEALEFTSPPETPPSN